MAEFVEYALEKLIPTFEQLQSVELFSPLEVNELIKKCRRFEYRTVKQTKTSTDFLNYANYLEQVIDKIKERRDDLKYHFKYQLIDKPLKLKTAFLYRICSDRFKRVEYFTKEIEFLRKAMLYSQCSRAYNRLIQFHGHESKYYINAGKFEFFDNKSVENARIILQVGIRKFPADVDLYLALFNIELGFVKYLNERQKFFVENHDSKKEETKIKSDEAEGNIIPHKRRRADNEIEDDILSFKLLRVVWQEALSCVPSPKHPELVYKLWCLAQQYEELVTEIVQELYIQLEQLDYKNYLQQQNNIIVEKTTSKYDQELGQWEEQIEKLISSGASYKRIEKAFNEAFLKASPNVASKLKTSRIRYLIERYPNEPIKYREEYKRLSKMLNNSEHFHMDFVDVEESKERPDHNFICSAFENAVHEFSTSVECWARYVKYFIRTKPDKVGFTNQRALLNLNPEDHSRFYKMIETGVNE